MIFINSWEEGSAPAAGNRLAPAAFAHSTSPLLRQRAANEIAQIEAVATHHAKRWAVVPLMAEEPVGVERLRQLAQH